MFEMVTKFAREFSDAFRFAFSPQFLRMAVFWTLSLLISYSKLFLGRKPNIFPRCLPPPMPLSISHRPVCVITGSTSGLGLAAARALSGKGFCVVLAGRSPRLLTKAMFEIKLHCKDAHVKGFHVDISSFQSILKFVESLRQWLSDSNMHPSIQLLINNAGILATSFRLSVDEYDQMMETNYLGTFFVTKLLLSLLLNSPVPSRVVNVSSFTHRLVVMKGQIDKEMVSGMCFSKGKEYPSAQIYEYSKYPGAVETNILREIPSWLSCIAFIALKRLWLLQLPEIGVNSILDAALAPVGASGLYFFGGKGRTINSSILSYNKPVASKLWNISSHLFIELCIKHNSNEW